MKTEGISYSMCKCIVAMKWRQKHASIASNPKLVIRASIYGHQETFELEPQRKQISTFQAYFYQNLEYLQTKECEAFGNAETTIKFD